MYNLPDIPAEDAFSLFLHMNDCPKMMLERLGGVKDWLAVIVLFNQTRLPGDPVVGIPDLVYLYCEVGKMIRGIK